MTTETERLRDVVDNLTSVLELMVHGKDTTLCEPLLEKARATLTPPQPDPAPRRLVIRGPHFQAPEIMPAPDTTRSSRVVRPPRFQAPEIMPKPDAHPRRLVIRSPSVPIPGRPLDDADGLGDEPKPGTTFADMHAAIRPYGELGSHHRWDLARLVPGLKTGGMTVTDGSGRTHATSSSLPLAPDLCLNAVAVLEGEVRRRWRGYKRHLEETEDTISAWWSLPGIFEDGVFKATRSPGDRHAEASVRCEAALLALAKAEERDRPDDLDTPF